VVIVFFVVVVKTKQKVLSVLSKMFGERKVRKGKCRKIIVTRWSERPFSLGSFSYISPNADGKTIEKLGENIDEKLFFAGEHTICEYVASVHGKNLFFS
jgi:monoamine oxidase